MNRTQAAEMIANEAILNAYANNTQPTLTQIRAIISEYQHADYAGKQIAAAAATANPQTAYRIARKSFI